MTNKKLTQLWWRWCCCRWWPIQLFIVFTFTQLSITWELDVTPRIYIKYDQDLPMFYGNQTDYFKILNTDSKSLLIGARNIVYNISLANLLENRAARIEWKSSDAHRELCTLKGKSELECQNFIRVYARIADNQIMICGTNSYKPLCRYYSNAIGQIATDDGNSSSNSDEQRRYEMNNEIEAQGRCPYNPTHNSTYVYTDGQLYSATVADFSGADPLIYRDTQRTEQYDLKQLNQPAFVGAVDCNGYVLVFFREIAMEHMNCGKAIYSRVGRVCKNDKGGPYKFSNRWTSFLKTRLNCSIPGEYPFYFDEIQAISKIIEQAANADSKSIIYAVFTTSTNAIPGSAICAFTVQDIMDSFDGRFKTQKDSTSNWLPIPNEFVPEPRPGKCVDDSRTLPSLSVNFIKMHTLMEQAVPAKYGAPILVRVNLKHRFTAITVDPQIRAMDKLWYDVIFVGTDDGRVVKFIYTTNGSNGTIAHVITETQALPHGYAVKELTVSRQTQSLIVVGDGHIISLPLHHCSKIFHCRDCFNLRDPYCIWDINNQECTTNLNRPDDDSLVAWATAATASPSPSPSSADQSHAINSTICKKRMIEPTPVIIQSSHHGTVTSMGQVPNDNIDDDSDDNETNEITMITIDGSELTNHINNQQNARLDPLVKEPLGSINNHRDGTVTGDGSGIFHMANSSIIIFMCVLFILGLTFGFFLSKLRVKLAPCYNEHRNQLTGFGQKRHLHPLNGSKDINLLMDNTFGGAPCNLKKDNLDQEFAIKDRSHECKNSAENLEKDLHCKSSGGGTSLKVIKTYL